MEGQVQRVILGQKVLLFRVNMNVKKDAIEKHEEVLLKDGFCWFGKIGRIPMREKIEEVLKEKYPHILLYTKKKLFLCDIDDSSFIRPKCGFPQYYYQEFFLKGEEPNLYLRITAMKEISVTELAKYYVATTAKTAAETLPNAKATFMFLVYNKRPVIVKKHRNIKPKVIKHDPDTCKYRNDGLCGNKYCVNYEYECLRPRLCIKRKD